MVRGFGDSENYLEKFRIKPNASLLRNLHYRTFKYSNVDHQKKIHNYMRTNAALSEAGIFIPGQVKHDDRSCWLLPMLVSNKLQFREFCKMNGLFAFRGATQLKLIPQPKTRYSNVNPDYREAHQAKWLNDHVIYLPIHTHSSEEDVSLHIKLTIQIHNQYREYVNNEIAKNYQLDMQVNSCFNNRNAPAARFKL